MLGKRKHKATSQSNLSRELHSLYDNIGAILTGFEDANSLHHVLARIHENAIARFDADSNPIMKSKQSLFLLCFYYEVLLSHCERTAGINDSLIRLVREKKTTLEQSLQGRIACKFFVAVKNANTITQINNFTHFQEEYQVYRNAIEANNQAYWHLQSLLTLLKNEASRISPPLRPTSAATMQLLLAKHPAQKRRREEPPQETHAPPPSTQSHEKPSTEKFYREFDGRTLSEEEIFAFVNGAINFFTILRNITACPANVTRLHEKDMECEFSACRVAADEFIVFPAHKNIHDRRERKLREGLVYKYDPNRPGYFPTGELRVLDTLLLPVTCQQGIFGRNIDASTRAWQILYGKTHPLIKIEKPEKKDADGRVVKRRRLKTHSSMHYLDGVELDTYLSKHRCNLLQKLNYFIEILEAIAALHQAGILHRDIKLENIKIHNGHAYLFDFGYATYSSNPIKFACGSPLYMAPEIAKGEYSPATDIFAMGITGAELFFSHDTLDTRYSTYKTLINERIRLNPNHSDGLKKDLLTSAMEVDQTKIPRLEVLTETIAKDWSDSTNAEHQVYQQLGRTLQTMTAFKADERGCLNTQIEAFKAVRNQYSMYCQKQENAINTDITVQIAAAVKDFHGHKSAASFSDKSEIKVPASLRRPVLS